MARTTKGGDLPRFGPNQLERAIGSIPVATTDATTFTMEFRSNDDMVIDLDRLCIGITQSLDGQDILLPYQSLLQITTISRMQIKTATDVVRGNGAVNVPAAVFDPMRGLNPVRLGKLYLASGETFQVDGFYASDIPAGAAVEGVATMGAPCILLSDKGCPAYAPGWRPNGPTAYGGSPLTPVIAVPAVTPIVFTLNESGLIGLSQLQLMINRETDPVLGVLPIGDENIVITQIALPNRDTFVQGDATLGTPALPGGMFSQRRFTNWVNLGTYAGSSTNAITVTVANSTAIGAGNASIASIGFPFLPDDYKGMDDRAIGC